MLPLALRQQINPEPLRRRAAALRRHLTTEARIVWRELHCNRLAVHFRRQQPLAPFIVDFYCHQARLVGAIDGRLHRQQQGYDHLRDVYLAGWRIRVWPVTNQALRNELPSVVDMIRNALRQAP